LDMSSLPSKLPTHVVNILKPDMVIAVLHIIVVKS
jgi:hypothetical protein